MLVLLAIGPEERHGYAIMGEVARITDGATRLGPGGVYTTIRRLLDDGLIEESDDLRRRLGANAARLRAGLAKLGFTLVPGEHPIIPVMLGEAPLAAAMAERLLAEGIYVIAFSYPVVPKGKARIRTQMSAAHSFQQIDRAVDAFGRVGRALGVIR